MEAEGELSAVAQQAREQESRRLLTLRRAFRFPQPDNSRIYDWARRHVNLVGNYSVNGAFDVSISPWLIDIFDALQDDSVRVVSFSKAIQIGGTMIADVYIPWVICNDPGPITFTMHVDDKVQEHAKTRLNPVLENCKPVAAMLPKPGPHRTTTEIYFGGFSLIMNAANLSDQQSQSVRYKINDELWVDRWQKVYADAIGRVTAYEQMGTSKVLNISQAGFDGGDGTTVDVRVFRAGHMAEWGAVCPSCGKAQPLAFAIRESDEHDAKQIGGVVWDQAAKADDDLWNVARAVETCRFRCPCGHEYADTAETREQWKRAGRYIVTNDKAPANNRSFHVESIVSRPMSLLVEEWLNACNEMTRTGNEEPMQKFRQKREAKPWRVARSSISLINVAESTYSLADYADGVRKVDGETMRVMTIDRQQTHWWVLIGAWTATPTFTLLYFGRVETVDQLRELQRRFNVLDRCVVEDRRYQPGETDRDCARFGWIGMMGTGRKTWTMENETTRLMDVFPYSDPRYASVGGGVSVPFYEASLDHAKDLLFNAINGRGFKWHMPKDCPQLYLDQLRSEEKREVAGKWKYVEVRQNFNHAIDVSAMAVMMAIIAGVVRFKLDETP